MEKASLREAVWDELDESGVARFPFPPHGRIPNYAGATAAAERLTDLPAWRTADAIKANPDAPQRPVRRLALEAGKTVYQAVPRLRDAACFVELDPDRIDDYDDATTLSGASERGRQIEPDAVEAVDLIVSGSVAVDDAGARVGKGEGYSDLEYAVLRELDLVDADTPVVTTVHERQVREADWGVAAHDVSMDAVVTPERTIRTEARGDRPDGIDWKLLDGERIAEIPVLESVRA